MYTYAPKIILNLSYYVCNTEETIGEQNTYAGRKASNKKTTFCESNKKNYNTYKYN